MSARMGSRSSASERDWRWGRASIRRGRLRKYGKSAPILQRGLEALGYRPFLLFARHRLFHQGEELLLEPLGIRLGLALGVDVDEGLVRVGQHLDPARLLEDLDPVERVDLLPFRPLGDDPHDSALSAPRAAD